MATQTATDDVQITWTVASLGAPLQNVLQRLTGTKLDEQGAANTWAGTTGLALVGALNAKAGTTGLPLQAVLNKLAGTTGLGVQGAAAVIAANNGV